MPRRAAEIKTTARTIGSGDVVMNQNSRKTARPRGRPFQAGISGNLNGRPKKTAAEYELQAACRAKAPEALAVLVRIMESGDNERNQLAAAQMIIERGYGRPVQPTENKHIGAFALEPHTVDNSSLTDEQLEVLASIRLLGE